jgi:hypothetical protein
MSRVAPGVVATASTPVVKKHPRPALARTALPISKVSGTGSSAPAAAVAPAMLEIEVEHKFAAAKLSIWVDDRLTFTHPLEGSDKKRLVLFHKVQGHEFHAMQVPAGKHSLRVRVQSGTDSYDQSGTVAGEFVSGKENLLQISFSKKGEMQVSLQ